MKINTATITFMATASAVAIVTLVAFKLSSNNTETFEGLKRPPRSRDELLNRVSIDNKLSASASKIVGNKKTPIYVFDNFLNKKECDFLINQHKDKLSPSLLTFEDTDKYFRTSETANFTGAGIEELIDQKMYSLLGLPESASEITQIQHYKVGNEFKDHVDAFDPHNDYEFWKNGQRTWTCMVYLNDVEEGGETRFHNLYTSFKPQVGQAIVWCSLKKNGEIDNDTLHCGSPVSKGEKWIITKWFLDSHSA